MTAGTFEKLRIWRLPTLTRMATRQAILQEEGRFGTPDLGRHRRRAVLSGSDRSYLRSHHVQLGRPARGATAHSQRGCLLRPGGPGAGQADRAGDVPQRRLRAGRAGGVRTAYVRTPGLPGVGGERDKLRPASLRPALAAAVAPARPLSGSL